MWRQGPRKGAMLCFGVPGTGPTPALAAPAGDETAKAFCGVSRGSRDQRNQRILQVGTVL